MQEEGRKAGRGAGTAMVVPFEGGGAGGNSYQGSLCAERCLHLTPAAALSPRFPVGSLRDRKGKQGHPTRRAGEIIPVCERERNVMWTHQMGQCLHSLGAQ